MRRVGLERLLHVLDPGSRLHVLDPACEEVSKRYERCGCNKGLVLLFADRTEQLLQRTTGEKARAPSDKIQLVLLSAVCKELHDACSAVSGWDPQLYGSLFADVLLIRAGSVAFPFGD